jgi:hypothetical protein
MDLGDLHARIKPDFDPTLPAPRTEWEGPSMAAAV